MSLINMQWLFFHLYRDASKSPSYWSSVCLHNMAQLAKEATTVRRVLEPLFHTFDTEDHWSPKKGLACSVLTYLNLLLEESGYNLGTHLSLFPPPKLKLHYLYSMGLAWLMNSYAFLRSKVNFLYLDLLPRLG